MISLKSIFKNIFKEKSIFYFLVGSIIFLFKHISNWELSVVFLFALIVINLLKKLLRLSIVSRSVLKNFNWIFVPLFFYSFFFTPRIIGLLMIAHFFSDPLARIIRIKLRPFHTRYFPKNINGTLFFAVSYFILSLLYTYCLDGFILKKYVLIFLVNSLFLGFLENSFKIKNYPDNFNLNLFGSLLVYISLTTDLTLRTSALGFNLIFGLFWCLIPMIPLILLDIINLKRSYKYYLFFVLLYASLHYQLSLFNILILTGMGLVKKLNQFYSPAFRYHRSFIEINEAKEYFL